MKTLMTRSGEAAALITVVAALLMVVGSVVGLKLNQGTQTRSLAATQPQQQVPTATPTPALFSECKVHFIIDNSSSVEKFKGVTQARVENIIKKYRTLPGHQTDTLQVNYQFFNKDVNPASPYVGTDRFAFPNPFPQENWTNIDAASKQAVDPSTATTRIVNILLTDGKPTILNTSVGTRSEQCVGSFEAKKIYGCRPCLRSQGASCPIPYETEINACPSDVKNTCLALDYNQKYIADLTSTQWVDYSVAIGDTPNIDLLNKVAKNGVIAEDDLATKIADIFERQCGMPAPTPGKERGRNVTPSITQPIPTIDKIKADVNHDGVVSALDVAACITQSSSLVCDIVVDNKINSLDRSAQISLLGSVMR